MSIFKQTKIVCTLGPSSNNYETILAMANAGMNVVRLNFSHGEHKDQNGRDRHDHAAEIVLLQTSANAVDPPHNIHTGQSQHQLQDLRQCVDGIDQSSHIASSKSFSVDFGISLALCAYSIPQRASGFHREMERVFLKLDEGAVILRRQADPVYRKLPQVRPPLRRRNPCTDRAGSPSTALSGIYPGTA